MKNFIKASLIGGLLVILPIAILGYFFKWLFGMVTDFIQPVTNVAGRIFPGSEFLADILALTVIILACFVVGVIVRTKAGNILHATFDNTLQKLAPGYRMVKEVVQQIFGASESSPFSSGQVARVKIYGVDCPTEVTALVTDRQANGGYTVFVPTGPNPTSGNIYHVHESQVVLYPQIKLDSAMRTIISCGAGSKGLFDTPSP